MNKCEVPLTLQYLLLGGLISLTMVLPAVAVMLCVWVFCLHTVGSYQNITGKMGQGSRITGFLEGGRDLCVVGS